MPKNVPRFRSVEQRLWASLGLSPTELITHVASGERIRVQAVGDGPPILFVHGASNGGASCAPLIAGLDGFRCLALDRPGCGLSEPIAGGAGLADVAAVAAFADALVADVLDALELATAHVVATSYGGYFALRGAAAHPERIDRLVELSWPMGAPMAAVPFSMRVAGIPGVGGLMARMPPTRASVRMLLRQIGLGRTLESGRFTDEMFDWFLSLLRDTDTLGHEVRATPKVITPIGGLNQRMLLSPERLARVSAPALFIWGGEDPNGGEDIARAFVARFPDARLEVLPTAGHAPGIDEPDTSAALIRAFLAS